MTILAIGMGGFSLTYTLLLYQKTHLRYLKIHNRVFILFNYMIFIGLAFNYFQFNLSPHLSSDLARKIFQAYHFQLSIVSFFLLYGFIILINQLLDKKWTRGWKLSFFIIFSLLITSQTIFSFLETYINKILVYLLCLLVIFFSVQILILTLAMQILLRAFSFQNPKKRQSLKKFSLLILAIFIPNTTLNFLQIFNMIPLHLYVFLKSFQTLIINLLPFLFMKGFVMKMFPEYIFGTGPEQPPGYLFEKYKISKREQEIIRLICQGKSNREIEDELFISLQTVKDHVYNIFQKTGVKNRVQLSNLFRGSGD